MIYTGVDGVVREASYPLVGTYGVERELEDGYVGVDGVSRQILWGHIPPEWIERMELKLDTLSVRTLDESGSVGDAVLTRALHGSSDLSAAAEYGSVGVNAESRMLEVNCSKTGYIIILSGMLSIILKSGRQVPSYYFSLLNTPSVTADYYLRFNWSGSSYLEGVYVLFCCGELLLSEYVSGGASGTKTVTPSSGGCEVSAGIKSGLGTVTTRMTLGAVTIGGTQFLPEITYGG